MKISIIKTEKEYKQAIKAIESLLDAKENSPESKQLELLSLLVENYESDHYKIESPDSIEAKH